MTDLQPAAFIHGFALSAALIVAIGAQNAFVLRQGLRREHVGPIVILCALADVSLMAAGVAGLGAAIGQAPGLTLFLALGGALFLGWYGLTALRNALADRSLVAEGRDLPLTLKAALLRTAGFTFLNPHVYLDTVVLVGSVGAALGEGARIPFVLGAGLGSALWFAALGYGARLLAPVFARPLAWRILDAIIGVTMLALAVGLVLSTGLIG